MSLERLLVRLGENIRLARLRRRLTSQMVSERAGISRPTLVKIEAGDPGVAIGAHVRVLNALGLADDILKVADDDELGRKLQDLEIPARGSRVASRREKS